jgi:hypothetical protein
MATAGLIYNRLRLNQQCDWNLGSKTKELYSSMFVLSGTGPLASLADAEATALDLWEPIRQMATYSELLGWSYYAPNSHAATFAKTYTAGTHPAAGTAWIGTQNLQQREVCILCEGPTDRNSRGKQVYLRKFIHSVPSDSSGNSHPTLAAGDPLAKWKTGSGPNLLVPIDTDSGTQATTWVIKTHLYTRQFRKGKKRKPITKVVFEPLPTP